MKSRPWLFAASAFLLTATLGLHLGRTQQDVSAADHTDAPFVRGEPLTDINDLYAFRAFNSNNLTLVMTMNPFINQPSGDLFDPKALYVFYVDSNADNIADFEITFTFSGSNPQRFTVSGINAVPPFSGTVTRFGEAPKVLNFGGISAFCGPRDDPFFFDSVGFNNFTAQLYLPDNGLRRSSINGSPANRFAGTNVSAIVCDIPITFLTGLQSPDAGTVRVWCKTFKQS